MILYYRMKPLGWIKSGTHGLCLTDVAQQMTNGQRLSKIITLYGMAAVIPHIDKLFLCFHAFCYHLQIQLMAYGDNRFTDGRVTLVSMQVTDEGVIDFNYITRKMLAVGQ